MATRTDTPRWMAYEELLWLKDDGSEVRVVARVGIPYALDQRTWACPSELVGVEGRYVDIQSGGSMQALCMAVSLLRTRLGRLIAGGERFVHPSDRDCIWDEHLLQAVFGNGFDFESA